MTTSECTNSVCITNTVVRTSVGNSIPALWDAIVAAQPCLKQQDPGDTRFDHPAYHAIQSDSPKDIEGLLLQTCSEAWAPWKNQDGLNNQAAMFVGSTLGGMTHLEQWHRSPLWGSGTKPAHDTFALGRYDGPAAKVAQSLKLPCITINTACSSSANALGLARLWLLKRRIDIALVAGYDLISPFVYAGFACLNALDPNPSRPFCANRAGLNLGEAVIACVLTRTDCQTKTPGIHLVGYGSSCDAHHVTRPDPTGRGLTRAITAAFIDAHLTAKDISAISAHGTGTPFNDAMESEALRQVFGDHCPPVHCAKPITGHTLGAAGILDAVVLGEALKRRILPATYGTTADAKLHVQPSTQPVSLSKNAIGLSTSSGFGGSNAALLLRATHP